MRVAVLFLVLAALVTRARPALASDAGGETETGGADVCADGGDCGDAAAPGSPAAVVACDGDLCDTLQGRPSCAVSSRSTGAGEIDPWWFGGAAIVCIAGLVRRTRRGA
jgi:hypothetical protein